MGYITLSSLAFAVVVVGWLLHSFLRELTHPQVPDMVEHQMEMKRGSKI